MGKSNPFTLDWILDRTVSESAPDYCAGYGDCRIWQGAPLSDGYGRASFSGKRWRIHVAAYTLAHGSVLPDQIVCHRCDRPLCVAPQHLLARTSGWNNADMIAKGRDKRVHGVEHPNSKLTESDVHAIRVDSRKYRDIANDYGVVYSAVANIKSGRTWAWLE